MTHATATLDTDILGILGFWIDFPVCEDTDIKEIYKGWRIFIWREFHPYIHLELSDSEECGPRWTYPAENLTFAGDDAQLIAFARNAIDKASA